MRRSRRLQSSLCCAVTLIVRLLNFAISASLPPACAVFRSSSAPSRRVPLHTPRVSSDHSRLPAAEHQRPRSTRACSSALNLSDHVLPHSLSSWQSPPPSRPTLDPLPAVELCALQLRRLAVEHVHWLDAGLQHARCAVEEALNVAAPSIVRRKSGGEGSARGAQHAAHLVVSPASLVSSWSP